MKKRWVDSLHKYLPQKLMSALLGWLSNLPLGWVTRCAVKWFIRYYNVNMKEAALVDYRRYRSFNAFFTRQLEPGARPMSPSSAAIISPVDGVVSEVGLLASDRLLQAKGQYYDVASLLGGDTARAASFHDGHFMTAYLAPKDYHRIHLPYGGRLLSMTYIPGRLFSVNPISVAEVPGLFARNERVVCHFDTELGPMAVIMVGALIVGSIVTAWHGVVNSGHASELMTWDYHKENKYYQRGQDIGHFKLGSTVIVLFAKDAVTWADHCCAEYPLRMGESIGVRAGSPQ